LDLQPGSAWVDTGIDLQPGDTVAITATGQIQYTNARQANGPEGLPRGFADLIRPMQVNDAGRGAVVGRIGASEADRPFPIGPQREARAPVGGRLFVAVNQSAFDRATGSYHLSIVHKAAPVTVKTEVRVPPFPQSQIDAIPRRVSDPNGSPGDRVNFIIIGSEDQMKAALNAAGWVIVDRSQKDAILRGILGSFSKEAYVTLPMSELRLFGRAQDLGYAQADPIRVVASRHHFRLWKAPFDLQGQTVWAGAGTHDIGFDRDQRGGGVTHKIDPATDVERDYIRDNLMQTGLVAKTDYITPTDPVKTAKTATGEEFTSDGRTLLIYLAASQTNVAAGFGDVFCSVLKANPGGGAWGHCSKYIDSPGKDDLKLDAISTKYRVLIVPGIFSSCISDAPAFQEGQEVLKKAGVDVALLQVPNDSSESNAKMIGQYLRDHSSTDRRKYILIGYSKGGPDVQVALAQETGIRDQVAAFITVAGASGGSPIADLVPSQAERYMKVVPIQSCQGDLSTGFKSLQRSARQAFLAAHPDPMVPTYSLFAKADQSTTSKALLETWRMLSVFGSVQDGQLLRDDAIVPGAKVLGAALSDHFAVALPFDKSSDSAIRSGMDKTAYPRAALLESLIRFVTADLEH
jgi:hypothetical protein